MPRLLATHGPHFGVAYELVARTTLGRSSACTIQLLDEKASRLHSAVFRRGDAWWVQDEGSSNGTGLNGRLLLEPTQLSAGDEVAIGDNLLLFEPDLSILRDLEGAGAVVLAEGTAHSVPSTLRHDADDAPAEFRLDGLLSLLGETLAGPRGVGRPAALVEAAVQGLGGSRGALLLAPAGDEPLKAIATHPHRARVTVVRTLVESVLSSHQPARGDDGLVELAVRGGRSMIVARPGSSMAFPIRHGGRVRGLFYVESDQRGAFGKVDTADAQAALVVGFAPLFTGPPGLLRPPREPADVRPPVAESAGMQSALNRLQEEAERGTPLLLVGEQGTGKAYLAQYVHKIGPRSAGPFVQSHVDGMPHGTMEIAFFGHEKGAVAGSDFLHRGLVEQADGGTLFVDAVEMLPPNLQARVLRALQEGRFYRVGGTDPVRVDVRFVFGTAANLDTLVADGHFRVDLLAGFGSHRIQLPALRERLVDVAPLVRRFVKSFNVRTGTRLRGFSHEALAMLETHRWPGNVDELKEVVDALLASASTDVVEGAGVERELADAKRSDDVERRAVVARRAQERRLRAALDKADGHLPRAAMLLGLPERHVEGLLDLLGIEAFSR